MASFYSDNSSVPPSSVHHSAMDVDQTADQSNLHDLPADFEDEAEVDELDSDSTEAEEDTAQAEQPGQKKTGKKVYSRAPGSTTLPVSRLENILQADGVTGALTMSKEASFVLSVATEEFIKRMAQAGHREASSQRRNMVHYADMAMSVQQYQEFMFLQDTIPQSISLEEALRLREAKEREDADGIPAMSAFSQQLQSASIVPPSSSAQTNGKAAIAKGKAKALANGKEKPSVTANSSSTARESSHREGSRRHSSTDEHPEGRVSSRSSRSRSARETRSVYEEVNGNGVYGLPSASWNGHSTPPRRSAHTDSRSPYAHDSMPAQEYASPGSGWAGQYTGPASGFIQDSSGGFAGVPQNPGRTIYSQQWPENGLYR
ncbi:hypothetical protein CONPUDRAFT_137091 [Coniophora puteana RWD-64-598 SS2]|uniref:Transcription factor CBF/NF-Y/archaeal histone domain-containing protein n=1 Tax=Coniophora puteana (strain RWD-64-598) TaxID=741705 RepID=A0A5M3MQP2_CONPW|nr:uncharacterized protein CONPUDRAFT_137091 [Coniophora puteana RWD-64-598 SS2]EIW80965.1 hypothetical protein CONPUDRAFT_137091 [Coniophora puteana RWD-64-598 SS2]